MNSGKLILVRHGLSVYNDQNRFTGWKDVELTERGEKEANKAGELIKNENLEDNMDVKLIDFRKMEGSYDKVVSVEMIEAIGFDLFNPYFAKIESLMKPGGKAVIQAINK